MTAEIAIMNKQAVAIAADSAATLQGGKILTTANKIFSLYRTRPAGVMVYGSAEFMSIPWETIIKSYRREKESVAFDDLFDAANDFIRYLHTIEISEDEQKAYIRRTIVSLFENLSERIRIRLREQELTDDRAGRVIESEINAYLLTLRKIKKPSAHELKSFIETYGDIVSVAKNEYFGSILANILDEIAYIGVETNYPSGIVITGFGEKDIFPKLLSFSIGGLIKNDLKYTEFQRAVIGSSNTATIQPFAQREMVDTFMQGVDPDYLSFLQTEVMNVISNIKNDLCTLEEQKTVVDTYLNEFINSLKTHRQNVFIAPVLDVVSQLSKIELAEMAESLIYLTELKRKVSSDAETVGGPIDVAVISKGDGFIWIKRKHYFNPELNRHFF